MVDDMISLQRLQVTSWLYLIVMTIGAIFAFSFTFALSVFAGGVISIVSFWVSHTDVMRMVSTLTESTDPEQRKDKVKKGKSGYLLKFWIRIAIIGVVLFFLIRSDMTNIFGLILGLSTVVFTITVTVLGVAWRYYFSRRR